MKRRNWILLGILFFQSALGLCVILLYGSGYLNTGDKEQARLSEQAFAQMEYPKIVTNSKVKYELYYLYDFLYIGDSFIERLYQSGVIAPGCTVLAKAGTAARDWYVKEDNPEYVNFLEQMQLIQGTNFKGIIIHYGINDVKRADNIEYSERLIDDVRKYFEGVPVYVLKILPVAKDFQLTTGGERVLSGRDINVRGKNNVSHFNEELENFCRKKEKVYFIDVTKRYLDKDGYLDRTYADERGLHIGDDYVIDWCADIFDAVTR